MTITTHSRSRRVAAAVGAIALAAVGVLGFAGSATADPIGGVGNIVSPDPSTSSIVVHKYTKTPTNGTAPGNGTQVTPTGSPIAGVTFSVQLVSDSVTPLNLLTNPGWTNASSIASSWGGNVSYLTTAPRSLGTASTQVTDASGIATFANLPYGLYLVQETASPTNVTDSAAPFLVTVPFPTGPAATNPTNPNEWLYAVHVYPKNSVTGIDKIVNTTDAGFRTAGDYISWTINSTIPVLATGVNLTTFTVTDTVTDGELDFVTTVPSGIAPRSVRVLDALGVNQSSGFVAGTDYTISPAAPVATDTTSTVVFTSTGLTKLAALPGGTVEFVVPTKVVAVPVGGTITNNSALDVNNSHLTDPATADFGQLRVLKFSTTNTPGGGGAVTTKTPLAGATFALYVDLDQDGVADAGEVAAANQVAVNGQNTWTSAATTGLFNIPALKVGRYLLVETVAPTGYTLDATPRPVTVTAGLSTTTPAVNYQEISNSQISPWALPFTGGNGVITFTIVGAGLMALALGFAFVAFRRRKQAEQA